MNDTLIILIAASLMLGTSDAGTIANVEDSGPGSLRQAINDAQMGEVITFEASLDGQTILLGGHHLLIDKDLTIDATALPRGVILDGNQESSVFRIAEGVSVFLSGLKIVNARGGWRGGAIRHEGLNLKITDSEFVNNTVRCGSGGAIADNFNVEGGNNLTVERTIFRHNEADEGCDDDGGYGGAIDISSDQSALRIIDCIFEQNRAELTGGAIAIGNTRRNVIRRSTFAANEKWDHWWGASAIGVGGDLAIQDCSFYDHVGSLRYDSVISASHLVIENSTFARNRVATAIRASRLHLKNSTISDNPNGIEMRGSEGVLTLENSIVAGNSQSNLVIGLNKVEYLGTNIIDQDPILAPLDDYGGLTLTMPPLAGSPAIDAGVWTEESPSTDQRGFARLSASPLDVGAVELRSGISISWNTGDSSPTVSWEPSLMDTPGGKWSLRRSHDLVNWQFWGGDLTTQSSVSFSDSGDEEFYSLIFIPE